MKAKDKYQNIDGDKYPILNAELGKRISTKEVAEFLGLDEDTVRKYYREYGGVRPTGPKGQILFFEKNILSALRREPHGLQSREEWTNPVERENQEKREGEAEALRQQEGSPGLGSRNKKQGLVNDRHCIFDG